MSGEPEEVSDSILANGSMVTGSRGAGVIGAAAGLVEGLVGGALVNGGLVGGCLVGWGLAGR